MRLGCALALVPAALAVGIGPVHAAAPRAVTPGACPAGHGVTVVLEPGPLPGGDRAVCEPDAGGRNAARLFEDAGWHLTRVSSQPAFVCRIAGAPADASCAQIPPADAYWSLWWSDGRSGWSYATVAVDGLTVPDGGAVAFTWVDGSGDGTPRTPAPGTAAATAAPRADTDDTRVAAGTARTGGDDGDGLPGWVPPLAVAAVVGAAGGTALARRRR